MPEFAAKQPKALCCGAVKTDTERNMLLENVEKYIIWLFFYSVVGWIYESTLCSVRAHKFINRGFLNGPYCPIYGWGAVLDILILGKVQNPVLLFFLGAIVTCSLEYFTSYIMEKLFHARWWDYSKRKFNINGRVCLLGAVVFGAFSVILIKLVHPLVSDVTNSLPRAALHWLAAVMFAIIAADECVTIGGIAGFNKKISNHRNRLYHCSLWNYACTVCRIWRCYARRAVARHFTNISLKHRYGIVYCSFGNDFVC